MTNDINLAKYVNLLKSNKEDIPADIYKEMANKVSINIQNIIENELHGKDYVKLSLLNINRNFIKRGIMTISYGSTIRGIFNQLLEGGSKQFEYIGIKNNKKMYSVIDLSICDSQIYFTRKEILKLSNIIHDVLYISYPSLKELVNYFKEINKFIHKLNLNIPSIWNTPSGLNIEQKYVKTKDKEIKFSVLGKSKSITIKQKLDKINLYKQNLGIMPNIVHSMDASNITLLIKSILSFNNNKLIPLLTIHDCFATNANYIDLLSYHVKCAFLSIYKNNDFVLNYHQDIINYLKKCGLQFINNDSEVLCILNKNKKLKYIKHKLPTLPNLNNSLDLNNNILFSKYFVH
jgi:DNA-directed RNA polymerase